MEKLLADKPDVVWEEVIPGLDGNIDMDQESALHAARGLRKNYEKIFGYKQKGDCYNPEYLFKINKAFCSEKIKTPSIFVRATTATAGNSSGKCDVTTLWRL